MTKTDKPMILQVFHQVIQWIIQYLLLVFDYNDLKTDKPMILQVFIQVKPGEYLIHN